MEWAVDTNVPIVANGRGTNASIDCRLAAISFLKRLLEHDIIVLDVAGEIQEEYRRHLYAKGQPGVGDRFFQTVLASAPNKVRRVDLEIDANTKEYVDFPADPRLANFDRSDRKFVAVGIRTGATIANATDSGWLNSLDALEDNGLSIFFVCGEDQESWFDDN